MNSLDYVRHIIKLDGNNSFIKYFGDSSGALLSIRISETVKVIYDTFVCFQVMPFFLMGF